MTTASRFVGDSIQAKKKRRLRLRASKRQARRKTHFRPLIDSLEPRHLLTTLGPDIVVTNPNDTEVDGLVSLREAVAMANAEPGPNHISFDLDETEITVNGQIVITDDVTIEGPGATQLGILGNEDRIFAIVPETYADEAVDLFSPPFLGQLADPPTVEISDLMLAEGVARNALGLPLDSGFSFGGGIYNLGSDLVLDEVVMMNNRAEGAVTAGGAIANEFGGTVIVRHSYFEGNSSEGAAIAVGGAITSDLGRVITEIPDDDTPPITEQTKQPEVYISGSEFVGNIAQAQLIGDTGAAFAGIGGGGALLNVTGIMKVTGSHFVGNQAIGAPGMEVPVPEEAEPIEILGGGAGFGGAILSGNVSPFGMDDSSIEVERSTFEGNVAKGGTSSLPGVPGGVASGGAISTGSGTVATFTRNQFKSNRAEGGDGGTGSIGGTGNGGGVSSAGGATLELTRNRFKENVAIGGSAEEGLQAAGRGGALGLDEVFVLGFFPGTATAVSNGDTFEGNTAVGGIGGGIYNQGDLELNGSRVKDNLAQGVRGSLVDFVPGYVFSGTALGGGISNIGTLDMSRVTMRGNEAVGADQAGDETSFALLGGVATYPGLAVGGGFHNIHEATVSRSTFIGNKALGGHENFGSFAGVANGGGIYNDGFLEISRSTIRNNEAVGGNGNVGDINAGGGYGGGLTSGSVTPLNVNPETGEPLPPPFVIRSAVLEMNSVTASRNEAVGGDGNAFLDIDPEAVPPDFPPISLFTGHFPAGGVGGGIAIYQGEAELTRVTATSNTAQGGDGGFGVGGGIAVFGFVGSVDVEMSRIAALGNTAAGGAGADGFGGGISIGGLPSLFAAAPFAPSSALASISRAIVIGNVAEGGGATDESDGGDGLGGGIYLGADSTPDISRSIVIRNRAVGTGAGEGVGGGIYNLSELAEIDALIFGNFASTSDDDLFTI